MLQLKLLQLKPSLVNLYSVMLEQAVFHAFHGIRFRLRFEDSFISVRFVRENQSGKREREMEQVSVTEKESGRELPSPPFSHSLHL